MKERIDVLLSKKFDISRTKSQSLIEEGYVSINGKIIDKPSLLVEEECEIVLLEHKQYVSRGAYKLIEAIKKFNLNFLDKVVIDMGASTGGFTQVALENGAKKVYAVDVGLNELDKSLVQDARVINMAGRDIRTLQEDEVKDSQIVVGDLSFISLRHILPIIKKLFGKIECVLLFKPQFECGKDVAKSCKGVIKDRSIHKKLLKEFEKELKIYDFSLSNLTNSPIKGKSGNIEYLLHLNSTNQSYDIDFIVDNAFSKLK